MNGHWLAGFLDGEACFDIPRQRKPNGDYFYCRISVVLRADDAPLLHRIAEEFGGKVYGPSPIRGRSNPRVRWEVSARADLVRLAKVLDRCPLQSKKAADYAVWRRALDLSCSKDPDRHERLAALRGELVTGRAYAEAVA